VVPTKFASALVEDPKLAEQNAVNTFLGRLGMPQDMAAAVAYLGSEDASYVTGETLIVSGGMHSRL
jgi:dehydrogenase/reductase SDR family member 4